MPSVPPELTELRAIWEQMTTSGMTTGRQSNLVKRTKTIAHLVPGMAGDGLSGPYVSQMLNSKHDRAPKRPMLVTLALAISAIYEEGRSELLPSQQEILNDALDRVQTQLRVRATQWCDPDKPLSAYAENLIVQAPQERLLETMLGRTGFTLHVRGGYRSGKTTLLSRVNDRLRTFGYNLAEVSLANINVDPASTTANACTQFAAAIGLEGSPADPVAVDRALEEWLSLRLGRTALVIDEVNTLVDAARGSELARRIFRDWGQRISRASDASPWRKLSIIVADSFTPDFVRGAAISSTATSMTTVLTQPFEDLDVAELVTLWATHTGLADSAAMPEESGLTEWATDIARRFGGQPFLVHDYVRVWAQNADPKLPWSRPALISETEGQRSYIDAACGLVQRASTFRPGTTTVRTDPEDPSTEVSVAASEVALTNIGIIVDRGQGYVWDSPFVADTIAPRLAARSEGR